MKTLRCAKNPRPATAYIIVWLRRVHSIRKGRRLVRYYQKGSGKPAKQPENSHALTAWKSYRTGFCIKIYQILLTPVSTRLPIEIVYESYLQLQRQQKEAKNPITDFRRQYCRRNQIPGLANRNLSVWRFRRYLTFLRHFTALKIVLVIVGKSPRKWSPLSAHN